MKHLGEYIISNKGIDVIFEHSIMLIGICYFFSPCMFELLEKNLLKKMEKI